MHTHLSFSSDVCQAPLDHEFGEAARAGGKRLVILDDDLGAFAISPLLLLQSPEVELLGITTVSGNVWRDTATAHTLRLLEIAGRTEVPVVPGAVFPLLNSEASTRRWEGLFGKLVYKGAWMERKWPAGTLQSQPPYHAHDHVPALAEGEPSTLPADEIAANFLIRKVREFPGQVTIIATGPMTNIALAQCLDPSFARNARELIYMGGSLNPQQRLNSLSAQQFGREYANTPRLEFNFRWDPEAASMMLRAPWKKVLMLPADPSTSTELSAALLERITRHDTPLSRQLRKMETGFPLWDELATAVWLAPSLIERAEELYVDVDTSFSAGYGNTLSWSEGYNPGLGEQLQRVVRDVRIDAFEALLCRLLNRPPVATGVAE
jgi:purine nucleosidase